jgi:CheY-like chemotaxis protein
MNAHKKVMFVDDEEGVRLSWNRFEWIHDKQPQTQFILLTGYGNDAVEHRVRQLGAFDYLNKPISPDTLAAVVTAASILDLAPPVAETVETPQAIRAEVEALVKQPEVKTKSGLRRTLEVVGGLIAAPILGLLFCIFLPVIGFVALFWTVGQSLRNAFKPAST